MYGEDGSWIEISLLTIKINYWNAISDNKNIVAHLAQENSIQFL